MIETGLRPRTRGRPQVDYGVDALAYKDFVHKELSLFSVADNQRSIPCIVDGLKPSQRKVLFSYVRGADSPRMSRGDAAAAT